MIVDDYSIPVCQRALHDFFEWHGLNLYGFVRIDETAVYWKKTSNPPLKMEKYKKLLH